WWRALMPVPPMYMPGRLRTASRPSSTLIWSAPYSLSTRPGSTGGGGGDAICVSAGIALAGDFGAAFVSMGTWFDPSNRARGRASSHAHAAAASVPVISAKTPGKPGLFGVENADGEYRRR